MPKLGEVCPRDLQANGGRMEELPVLKQHFCIFAFGIPGMPYLFSPVRHPV